MKQIMYKLSLAATVYYLWRGRNSQIFQQKGVDSNTVVRRVLEEVGACACSQRKIPPPVFS
ncbi:hypothetical protein RHMOL_Rhmol11G0068400 [Rhododendron molle]|uniref:Uncharacterized protein n=1 Tax=Rhododendron molle TaxID=49168 RepID=A0ACC0LQX8_RHOML|nr:hypothetical protein RHMOL_Rhmol11G0068400 [Rhododendron molle]